MKFIFNHVFLKRLNIFFEDHNINTVVYSGTVFNRFKYNGNEYSIYLANDHFGYKFTVRKYFYGDIISKYYDHFGVSDYNTFLRQMFNDIFTKLYEKFRLE